MNSACQDNFSADILVADDIPENLKQKHGHRKSTDTHVSNRSNWGGLMGPVFSAAMGVLAFLSVRTYRSEQPFQLTVEQEK